MRLEQNLMMSPFPVQISQPFKFNPYEPEYRNNIYEIYDYMRSHEPVHQGLFKEWYLTRYTHVKAVFHDPRFEEVSIPEIISNKSQYLQNKGKNLDALVKSVEQWLFFLAPPEHTRMRSLVSKAFKSQNFQHHQFQVQEIANNLINKIKQQGSFDLISDFAEQLPAQARAQMLGLPSEDSRLLQRWSKPLVHAFDAFASLKICNTLNEVALESTEYFRALIAERRRHPRSDLISALIAVEKDGEKLTEQEILSTCSMLTAAGISATAAAIGNSVLALLRHPEQLELLINNPEILPTAIEELIRYDSAVQFVVRRPTEVVEIRETTIHPYENVILCVGAANRDSEQFFQPDQLDLFRKNNQHLSFAAGIHMCIGAAVTKMELPIAISTLAPPILNLGLTTEKLEYHDYLILRYLKYLPLNLKD